MFFNMSLFCLKGYSETFIQSLITSFLLCQPLGASQNISLIRTGNSIYDPHGMINFSNRGITGFGILNLQTKFELKDSKYIYYENFEL